MDLLNCFIALQLHIFSHCNQRQEKWWIWLRLWEASYYNTKSKGFGAGKWSYYTTKLEGLGSQKWGKIRGGWNQRHPKRTSLQLHPVHRLFSLHHRVCVDFWVDNSHGSVTTSIRTSGSGHRSSWNLWIIWDLLWKSSEEEAAQSNFLKALRACNRGVCSAFGGGYINWFESSLMVVICHRNI